MNETSDTLRRRAHRGPHRGRRPAAARRTALLGGAIAVGATLPFVGLAASAQAADPDTRAPESTAHLITEPPSGWFQSSTPVSFTANDFGGAGIATIAVVVDGVGQAYPGDSTGWFTIEGDGVHTIGYRAIDNAGNLEPWRTVERRIDGGAPTIALPADGAFELDAPASLAYECADALSGIASCTAAVPSGGALDTSTAGTFTVPVTATDAAGNTFTAVYTYTVAGVDTTAPAVTLQIAPEPASGWYASYLGIGFTAEDPSGIASVHWNTDGAVSTNGDVFGEAWGGFDLDFDGVTEVWGWAYDTAGNRGETERRTVRIDTVAPRIDLASPELPNPAIGDDPRVAAPELEFEQGELVPLEYDCVDEHSGIASCLAQDELPALAAAEVLPTDELGEHVVTLRALDIAGNESSLELRYLVVEAAEEPGGGNGGNGGNGGGEQPGDGSGGAGGAQAPGHQADGDDRSDRSADSLAETGFPVLPGILLVAGLFAAGAILLVGALTRRPVGRDGRRY